MLCFSSKVINQFLKFFFQLKLWLPPSRHRKKHIKTGWELWRRCIPVCEKAGSSLAWICWGNIFPCMNLLGEHFPLHEFVGGTFSLAWIFSPHPYHHPYNGPSEKQRNLPANPANRLQPEMKLGRDFPFSVSVLKLKLSLFLCSRQRPQRSKSSDMTHGKRFLKWIAVTELVIRYGSL